MTSFEDRIARIAEKRGFPMEAEGPSMRMPAPMPIVAIASARPDEQPEIDRALRANLNAPDRQMMWITLCLGGVLGMIAGLLFHSFIGFDTLRTLSVQDHMVIAMRDPAYMFAWLAILMGPVMFGLLAPFRTNSLRLTQFAGIYFGTSLGINCATMLQNTFGA